MGEREHSRIIFYNISSRVLNNNNNINSNYGNSNNNINSNYGNNNDNNMSHGNGVDVSGDDISTNGYDAGLYEDMEDLLYQHEDPFIIFLIVVYVIAFAVGFMGNLFVILVVLRHRHMRTLTNVFFFNLTIGDFMVTCICIPITLGNYVYRDWIYGEIFCKVTPFLQGTAVGVSVLSMLSISINRYFAIHIPLRAKILFSRTRVHIMLASIWILSFGASSPLLLVKTVTSYGIPDIYMARVCNEIWLSTALKHVYNLVIFLLLFLCPLTLMSILYLKISLALWSKNRELFDNVRKQTFMSPQVDRLLLQRRKTVRTLVLLVVLFAVSWFPYYVVNAWLDFNVSSSHAHIVNNIVYPLAQLVGLSNSSVNPILYCFLSNGFRRAFMNMCCRRKKRTRNGLVMTVRYRCSDDSGVGSVETVLS